MLEKLLEIIAATYQIAGVYGAPDHVLDVLCDPEEATQAQIDALLPFKPDSLLSRDEVRESLKKAWTLGQSHWLLASINDFDRVKEVKQEFDNLVALCESKASEGLG